MPHGYSAIGSIMEIIHAVFDLHESGGTDIKIPRSVTSLCNKENPGVPCGWWSLDRQLIICFCYFITWRRENGDLYQVILQMTVACLHTHSHNQTPPPSINPPPHTYKYCFLLFPLLYFLALYHSQRKAATKAPHTNSMHPSAYKINLLTLAGITHS